MKRRTFLKHSLYCAGLVNWQHCFATSALAHITPMALFASALTKTDKQHALALFDEKGQIHWQIELPERAHAPFFHPNKSIVGIVGRRAGYYLDLYNIASAKRIIRLLPQEDHHFYGHATFTYDGNFLLTTENHFPSGAGKIMVRDWRNNRLVSEFPSYGIGPHELHLLNETTLVVANGGLQTHPASGRRILNHDNITASLTFIDIITGKLIKKLTLADSLQKLSIRHIDINSSGDIIIGFQHQGERFAKVPLVGKASLEHDGMAILPMPETIRQRFKQYCGSVTFDRSGKLLAASSPRGGIVAYWDLNSNTLLQHHNYQDVCGITATANNHEFLLTTGQGKRIIVNPTSNMKTNLATHSEYHWDNHIHSLII